MRNAIFRFKQFEVDQTDSTMKINTDGVLLGAMSMAEKPSRILDIGTGTGVIAMMLAQRFPSAHIDAVEIDPLAATGARKNFQHSPFANRLVAFEGSFETIEQRGFYDLIVSNPPFYTNSLHNPDERKKNARHADLGFFKRLLAYSYNALKPHGTLQLILPKELSDEVRVLAEEMGYVLHFRIVIRSFREEEAIRTILSLSKSEKVDTTEHDFIIYAQQGVYSDEYRRVLQPFFLAF